MTMLAEDTVVSEACQINDLDLYCIVHSLGGVVSEACQINDLDLDSRQAFDKMEVSEACQINDLDLAHTPSVSS